MCASFGKHSTLFYTLKHFIKHRSTTVNGAMFVKSDAICDVREMVPLRKEYLTAVKKVNKP